MIPSCNDVMKACAKLSLLIVFLILLVSCSKSGLPPTFDPNLTNTAWKRYVQTDPNRWKVYASPWFLFGEPAPVEIENRLAGQQVAMSTTMVQVSDFINIDSEGGYQLQIFGCDHNSVVVYGPNQGSQSVSISQRGGTLYIRQTQALPYALINKVIVRVGVRNLNRLTQRGQGRIEAVQIKSPRLYLNSYGSGPIYLAGCFDLREVRQAGCNNIYIFGANSPALRIVQSGPGGRLNIEGQVGLRSIDHFGQGDINIIGAFSDNLNIYAQGNGKIGLIGLMNVCQIIAKCDAQVYIQGVQSREKLSVQVYDRARVGLEGSANILSVDTCNRALFEGRTLCSRVAYVRAANQSHVNLSAAKRAFVSAKDTSKVYVYSDGDVMDVLSYGHANVLNLPGLRACLGKVYSFKSELPPAPPERMYRGAG